MPASQIIGAMGTGVNVGDNTTRFAALGHALHEVRTTESQADTPIRVAGTFSNLFVRILTNTATVNSTVTLRKSAADTALTLTIGADLTGEFEDITNSVAFANTDEATYEITVPTEAGTNNLTVGMLGVQFTPDDGALTYTVYASSGGNIASASATRGIGLTGVGSSSAETIAALTLRGTFIGRNLYVNVSANARTTNTVFKSRKNVADGAMSVTYAAAETGIKEDTSNTDSLASGDTYNLGVTTGTGTETLTFVLASVALTSAARQFYVAAAGAALTLTQAINVTNFLAPGGDINTPTTTEATHQLLSRITCTAKELTAKVTANAILTSATLIRSRMNGADGNQSLSYATLETGVKSDTSNTDAVTAGSTRYNWNIVTPNTAGNIEFAHIGMIGEVAGDTLMGQACL